jgi:hypothetical protein
MVNGWLNCSHGPWTAFESSARAHFCHDVCVNQRAQAGSEVVLEQSILGLLVKPGGVTAVGN